MSEEREAKERELESAVKYILENELGIKEDNPRYPEFAVAVKRYLERRGCHYHIF